ncbi:MAG: exodeoxyribonuclease VII large subunit [Candidatus Eremiobacteraeota bacterium]|nr:exodeoxyribonuclease VII large subunit [Candidatus Eremiobacteraeota bacterium]
MNQPAPSEVYGVSRFVRGLEWLFRRQSQLQSIAIRGEVSNLRRLPSGRIYFDLKEGSDLLACVVWENRATALPPLANGNEAVAIGTVGIYSGSSKYQLVVADVALSGIGALFAQVQALRERFKREGLFDAARRRPLPEFPRRVAVVSARAKGAEDFIEAMARDAPHVEVTLIETRVQGVGAEIDIAEALDRASRMDVDVIVLTRGGGSYEDLFPFNLEPVVRAIVRSRHPVISAIAHTGDRHLADDVADLSLPTPSIAAQHFSKIRERHVSTVYRLSADLDQAARRALDRARQLLDLREERLHASTVNLMAKRQDVAFRLERRLDARNPYARLGEQQRMLHASASRLDESIRRVAAGFSQRLAPLDGRLARAAHDRLRDRAERVRLADARLTPNDPAAVLRRGYAIVTYEGRAVRDAGAVPKGALIEAKLERGALEARVERSTPDG